jgi:hypothetical protein
MSHPYIDQLNEEQKGAAWNAIAMRGEVKKSASWMIGASIICLLLNYLFIPSFEADISDSHPFFVVLINGLFWLHFLIAASYVLTFLYFSMNFIIKRKAARELGVDISRISDDEAFNEILLPGLRKQGFDLNSHHRDF